MSVHSTAIVGRNVRLAENVEVGAYAVIEGEIEIGRGTKIYPHVHIMGCGEIGENNLIHTGAVIGDVPQDLTFSSVSFSSFKIGSGNTVREMVTIHRSAKEGGITKVGSNNFLMACSHIAYDCIVGDNVVMANASLLAGNVRVFDQVFISGGVVIHQFCRIGRCSMISGNSRITKDVSPFSMVAERNEVYGINAVGMKRNNFSKDAIKELKEIYKIYYKKGVNKHNALEKIKSLGFVSNETKEFIDFIENSERGVC
ncbi:MAG: acyl-ACP--UDP-N-acetylglucosamine O-acyltransferase [Candidatus Aureabacteria bacterium]|nr:acyl-ACP--UDP-N-acetylglucosamine O-acyltransferase [Candidatus Auribacterota bacterium]